MAQALSLAVLTATQSSKLAAEMAIQSQHLARQNYYRHIFSPLNSLDPDDPNVAPSPTLFLDTKSEVNEVTMPGTVRVKDSVMVPAASGNDTYTNFLDFSKPMPSCRMERHYLQQHHQQTFFLHPQSQESATPWPSTSTTSVPLSKYSQNLDSRPSTPHTDCSSFDIDDLAPGWRLRKIKATAEARSAPAPLRSLPRDPQFPNHVQRSPLPPRPIHHWTSAIFQVGGTPCLGFRFGSLANEALLDFNFLCAGSPANEMKNSSLADFVSLDRFFQREPCVQASVDGVEAGQDSDSGFEHVGEEPWTVGFWPLVLDRIQKGPLEYLAELWQEQFKEQHVDHEGLDNPMGDLD
ncbi:hypothetical protein BGZ74_001383, partial [Mortierella antarctica]